MDTAFNKPAHTFIDKCEILNAQICSFFGYNTECLAINLGKGFANLKIPAMDLPSPIVTYANSHKVTTTIYSFWETEQRFEVFLNCSLGSTTHQLQATLSEGSHEITWKGPDGDDSKTAEAVLFFIDLLGVQEP